MKITMENMGLMRYAEMDLGDLTIICGENNTGKTQIAYAIYGFFRFWNDSFQILVDNEIVKKLKDAGFCKIQLDDYIEKAPQIVEEACLEYTKELSTVFAVHLYRVKSSIFNIIISPEDIKMNNIHGFSSILATSSISYTKKPNENEIIFTLSYKEGDNSDIPDSIIEDVVGSTIKSIIFSSIFPNVFIASTERTGSVIFRNELNFSITRVDDNKYSTVEARDIMLQRLDSRKSYALPVRHSVNFMENLDLTSRGISEIYTTHKAVIDSFEDILGGSYQTTDLGGLFFTPQNNQGKTTQLTTNESSSSVRSLLHIGFYLKHQARVGDLLIIDEPELNLHPKNQRKIARLLASLVNCGLKILITTHSDYILRELNNLILLSGDSPHLKQIVKERGYTDKELLTNSKKVRLYTAEEGSVLLPSKKRKTKVKTLVEIPIDNEMGIPRSNFDDVINEMNLITDDIVFGA